LTSVRKYSIIVAIKTPCQHWVLPVAVTVDPLSSMPR
jgi:hypothetical protein